MDEKKQLDYDSDIIICEEIPETISVSTSPELKKPKTKKRKRKVKKLINFNKNMETLMITQKLKVKKTKFKCVININTVCEKRSESIVRFNSNVCKKEAYYHRIVPICLREMCSGDAASCCRSTISRDHNKYYNYPKAESLSSVSSLSLSEVNEVFSCNNISYEDVSNGSFSSVSEELDTLIKRTRQREKQIDNRDSVRKYTTSTPTFKADDIASPFSIDMDKKSIHSDNTMILNSLPTEPYSPTSDLFKMNNLDIDDTTNDMNDIDIPYSPTMTPDLIKMENIDYSPVDRTNDDDDVPYAPTYTPETIEVEMDYHLNRNPISLDEDLPYSPTFTPDIIGMENLGEAIEYAHETNELYSSTMTPDMIKMENSVDRASANETVNVGYSPRSPTVTPDMIKMENSLDRANVNENVNVGYSPRSPTVTPNFHRFSITQTDDSNHNALYCPAIKQENSDESTIIRNAPKFTILTPDLIKKEKDKNNDENSNETDYNMNNTIHCKTEKYDYKRGFDDQADQRETIVKIEKYDHKSVNYGYSMAFK